MTTIEQDEGYGVLTDRSFERSRERMGVPARLRPPHITQVHADAIRHFAYGYSYDNPLYWEGQVQRSGPVGHPHRTAELPLPHGRERSAETDT